MMEANLCRNGPTASRTYAYFTKDQISLFKKTGLFMMLQWRKVQPPVVVPGMVFIDLGTESVPHAIKLARGLHEVILDSIPKIIKTPLHTQFTAYNTMSSWPLVDFIRFAKHATAWPLARHLHNDLPQCQGFPTHPLLYKGKILRILKNRLNSYTTKNTTLFLSILQGVKRAAEKAPESFVKSSFEKHKKILTTPRIYDPEESPKFDEYFHRFWRKFKSGSMTPRNPYLLIVTSKDFGIDSNLKDRLSSQHLVVLVGRLIDLKVGRRRHSNDFTLDMLLKLLILLKKVLWLIIVSSYRCMSLVLVKLRS